MGGCDLYRDEREARRKLMYVPDVPRFYLELTAWTPALHRPPTTRSINFEQQAERLRAFGLWDARDLFPSLLPQDAPELAWCWLLSARLRRCC